MADGGPPRRQDDQGSPRRSASAPPNVPRRALLAVGAGLGATGLLAVLGPHPVTPAAGRSGDAALLTRAEPHLRGLNRVSLAYLDGHTTKR